MMMSGGIVLRCRDSLMLADSSVLVGLLLVLILMRRVVIVVLLLPYSRGCSCCHDLASRALLECLACC